jgi:monoamine oxidase
MQINANASQDEYEVAIIGAGMAGIAAAKELRAASRKIILLEARDRIGGRAYTESNTFGAPFDHGCSWVHSANVNPLTPLLAEYEFGHLERNFNSNYDLYFNGSKASVKEKDYITSLFEQYFELAVKCKGDQALHKQIGKIESHSHDYTLQMFALGAGVNTDQISTHSFATEIYNGKDYYVPQGLGNLVKAYAGDLPVSLNSVVKEIDWSGKLIRITTGKGVVKAAKIILTVPLGVLIKEKIKFTPALPLAKQELFNHFQMGLFNKIAIKFKPGYFDFPTNYRVTGLNCAGLLYSSIFNFAGTEICVSFIGGDVAKKLEQAGDQAATDLVISNLSEVLGSKVREAFDYGMITKWNSDPFSYGSYSAPVVGYGEEQPQLSAPIDDRIFFAGEAYHPNWTTQLAGAYITGKEAANTISQLKRY